VKHREPVAAGRFYPGSRNELKANLEQLFLACRPSFNLKTLRAVIAPHAGYIFSGEVAASAYNQLPADAVYQRVFIFASSHCARYKGASIYNQGHYKTPVGKIEVDLELVDQLIGNHDVFSFYPEAHSDEHSVEVQLPFLRYKLGKSFKLVPVVIGTNDLKEIEQIAGALRPYFTRENLFVVSTDFSHYPHDDDAREVDQRTAEAILKNDPDEFYKTIQENKKLAVSNLVTSICGWSSMLALLYLTAGNELLKYHHIQYKNSGDAKLYSDRNRVVGYHAMVVSDTWEETFSLSERDKEYLLKLARERLSKYLRRQVYISSEENIPEAAKVQAGAFVTIYKGRELRGCIGRFSGGQQLYKLVEELAVSSANDYRFDPVSEADLPEINIEISVLTPLKRIFSIDEFELGKHGIYIKQGDRTGTFLPQVAGKTGWDKEKFISRCSRDKAQIGTDGWKSAELYTYEAIIFSEKKILH
jgi:MEMO1 family protein